MVLVWARNRRGAHLRGLIFFAFEESIPAGRWVLQADRNENQGKGSIGVSEGTAQDQDTEWQRSEPDIVVFRPKGGDRHDTDNEHFLVFESPSGNGLLALWTQSSCEGRGDNHLVLARSTDGEEWSEPEMIVGTTAGGSEKQASWGFPVVSDTGRIYCFYTKEVDRFDNYRQVSGTMGCVFTDDEGKSWSEADDLPMPRSRYDNPDSTFPKNWIVWQKPIRDSQNRWIAGYSLWTSQATLKEKPDGWWHCDSRSYFMRFDNIHEGPHPSEIRITWLPEDDAGIEAPLPTKPGFSAAEEPALALLPDGRLFVVMRTWEGHAWYSVSEDDGAHWRPAEMLRYRDGGEGIEHPFSCCPFYAMNNGRYLLLFHNNPGKRLDHDQLDLDWSTNHLNYIRNPTFMAVGTFQPEAHQPVWFSEPRKLFDTGDVQVGPKGTAEIATYPSMTEWNGKRVLWYPDRKYYLLGKYITEALLAGMTA
jgi:hypothetical protein